MFATKVTAKVVQDNSGVATEIPVILTDQGVLGSVTDYVLSLHLTRTFHKHPKQQPRNFLG